VWVNFLDFSLYHNKANNSLNFFLQTNQQEKSISAAKFFELPAAEQLSTIWFENIF